MTQALETLLRPVVENALLAADMAGETYGSKASRITEKVIEALNTRKPCDAGLREDARWLRELAVLMRNGHKFTEGPRHAERIERIAAAIAALSKGDATR